MKKKAGSVCYKWQPRASFVFCYSNSCNSSLVLCAAEMSRKSKKLALVLAFELNGEDIFNSQRRLWMHDIIWGRNQYTAYNNFVQELWLDDAWLAEYFRKKKNVNLKTCYKTLHH